MSMAKAGCAVGFTLLLGACKELDCGEGHEHELKGIRESTVEYWRAKIERINEGLDGVNIEKNVCLSICAEETPYSSRYWDCGDLQLDGGTAGAPGTGGDTGAGGSNGAGGAYGPIPVEGEPTYSVVCITAAIEDCGKLIR